MYDSIEKSNPIFGKKENFETSLLQEQISEENNYNMTFNSTNERYFINAINTLLNKKRENDYNPKFEKKHTKFSYDNLKRECKHLVIENVINFVNKKIVEVYEGNIGNGIITKKLLKLNQSQKINSDVEFNKLFINKSLKEILSQNITKKYKLFGQDHNKKVIEKIIVEKKSEFEKLFNITFIECVEHFIGKKKIKDLDGLTLFSELKEQILNKYEKDGESYYENLKMFLERFENKINRAKSRKKRIGVSKSLE